MKLQTILSMLYSILQCFENRVIKNGLTAMHISVNCTLPIIKELYEAKSFF